jgi:hypothetical protein
MQRLPQRAALRTKPGPIAFTSMNPLVTSGLDSRHGGTALSVNVNKVALLRNSRALDIPNLVRAATTALEAGAAGITIHPARTNVTSARATLPTSPS